MSLSSPTSARPDVRFSPFSVRGSSVVPVCRPFSDHSVSPWRMMKARGVVERQKRRWSELMETIKGSSLFQLSGEVSHAGLCCTGRAGA